MKRMLFALSLVAAAAYSLPARAGDKPQVLDVWPGPAPGDKGDIGPEKSEEKGKVTRTANVTHPTLTVFRPAKEKDNGAAVVIAPGGGYSILAWDLEGTEVAAWLNSIGVTGIVLKYRVPRRPDSPKDRDPQAQMDAQRAMSLVRSRAKELGIDPKRLGMLGFSAGGNLTAWTSTNFDKRCYETIDDVDRVSCRPDFTVLIYPAYLTNPAKDALLPDIRITKDTPPMFFAHAYDDGVPAEGSILMYLALKKEKVPAEMHIYATGGHGFGLRPSDRPCSKWPERCGDWMKSQGLLTRK